MRRRRAMTIAKKLLTFIKKQIQNEIDKSDKNIKEIEEIADPEDPIEKSAIDYAIGWNDALKHMKKQIENKTHEMV